MNITASDRSALVKLASSLPKGSDERRAILASLKVAGCDSPKLPEALQEQCKKKQIEKGDGDGKKDAAAHINVRLMEREIRQFLSRIVVLEGDEDPMGAAAKNARIALAKVLGLL